MKFTAIESYMEVKISKLKYLSGRRTHYPLRVLLRRRLLLGREARDANEENVRDVRRTAHFMQSQKLWLR